MESLYDIFNKFAKNDQDKSYKSWRILGYIEDLAKQGIYNIYDLKKLEKIPSNLLWNDTVVKDLANYLNMEIVDHEEIIPTELLSEDIEET